MKINISSWLISQVQLYPFNSLAVFAGVTGTSNAIYLRVSLYSVTTNSQCGNIQIVWVFTGDQSALTYNVSSVTLGDFYRLDNPSNYFYAINNYVIQLDYKWGQVALIECISISGAN